MAAQRPAAPTLPLRKDGYPKAWKAEIVPRILARDSYRCAKCRLPQHAVGYRDEAGQFYAAPFQPHDLVSELAQAWLPGEPLTFRQLRLWVALLKALCPLSREESPKGWFVVKLGVAHLDHDLVDHSDANLAALCAQCHLRHDVAISAPRAAASRRYGSKRAQSHYPLFTDNQ